MKIRRIFFLLNSIWELVRFLFLFLAVWITFQQVLKTDSQAIFWLMLFGNGGLLVAAALLFLYVDPPRFRALLNLVRLGKSLGLFSALGLWGQDLVTAILKGAEMHLQGGQQGLWPELAITVPEAPERTDKN